MSGKLRVAVLGAGFMGSTHARAYAKLEGVEVAAIVSRGSARAQALADELGARHLTDETAVLDDASIDVVDVSYPTHEHERLAVAALRAGKHVLLEKPIALSLESADRILAAWRASGRKLMVAHVLRFWPEYVALHDIVAEGRIGRPLGANAYRLQQRPAWSTLFDRPDLTGGPVVDLQIHDDDALNWIFGQPRAVYSQGQRSEFGAWDFAQTTIAYDGASAFAEGGNRMPAGYPFSMGLRVLGERGAVEYHFRAAGTSVEMGRQEGTALVLYEPGKEPQPIATPAHDAYEAEVAYFVDRVRRDEPVLVAPPESARLALEVALAARESLETGEVVRLGR